MMDFEPLAESLRQFVPNYNINFVDIKEYSDSEKFKTELKTFSGLYYCKGNKKKMNQYITSHEECRYLDRDTFWTIANIAENVSLKGLEKYKEKEECSLLNTLIY